jgi:c-di-GMP-binding flagellar brake protein YcgR
MAMTIKRAAKPAGDRRRMPRLAAPVIYRQSGSDLFHHQRSSVDVSAGGMRALSDEPLRPGDQLELDLLPPGDSQIRMWARVAWIERLPDGADASYEVGLQFTDIADEDRQRLASLLVRAADSRPSPAAGHA